MKNSHLTLDDRKKIQEGLEKELSRTEIAKNINKDISTVAKEIKNRRKLKPRNPFNNPITCTKFKQCGVCHGKCSEYEEIKCSRRDRKVGVCNLCPDISKCRLDKYFYYARQAHESYQYTLKDAREGVNLNTKEMLKIVDIIKPLLKKGQFVYQILENHPELKESMASTLDNLQNTLEEDYCKLFSLLLTDRGSEFEKYELFEVNTETGEIRSNIFYCDPQTPSQKPHIENNHNYVRDIIPNGTSLKNLTQEDLDLMFSHINSAPRKSLNGRTPYETFEFLYGATILKKLNIQKIEKDMVTLQPYLLKIK